jgi:hypothetical protein
MLIFEVKGTCLFPQASTQLACPALGNVSIWAAARMIKMVEIVSLHPDPVIVVWQSECKLQKVHVRTQNVGDVEVRCT